MRMDRRAGLLQAEENNPLVALFSDMNIFNRYSTVSTSTSSSSYAPSKTFTLTSFPRWLIVNSGAGLGFYYTTGGSPILKKEIGSYTTYAQASQGYDLELTYYGWYTRPSSQNPVYGIQIIVCNFPHYTADEVNDILSNMTGTLLANRNQPTTSTVRCSSTLNQDSLYLQALATSSTYSYFSICKGDKTNIIGSPSSMNYWYLNGSYYYLSANGSGSASMKTGVICKLDL